MFAQYAKAALQLFFVQALANNTRYSLQVVSSKAVQYFNSGVSTGTYSNTCCGGTLFIVLVFLLEH